MYFLMSVSVSKQSALVQKFGQTICSASKSLIYTIVGYHCVWYSVIAPYSNYQVVLYSKKWQVITNVFLDWLQLFYKYKRLSGWVLLASINSSNTLNSIDYCHLPFPKVKRGIIARSDITPWTLLWHGYLIGYVKPGCKLPAEKPYIVLKMIRVLFLSYMLTQLLTHCSTYCHIALSGLYWINLLQITIPISKGDWVSL